MRTKVFTMITASCISYNVFADNDSMYSYLCRHAENTETYQVRTATHAKTLVMYPGDSLQTKSTDTVNDVDWIKANIKPEQLPKNCLSYVLSQGYWEQGKGIARFHFQFDSSELSANDEQILSRVFELVKNVPNVTLVGHTDNVGSKEYNQQLGFKRAEWVSKLLTSKTKSIETTVSSRGETQPLSLSNNKSGRALNRRVEVFLENNEQ
ncbi:OmpA family protein [Vibrio sp. CAIM 722]|uniref:OmpA family protein n=1 Tax=Vibrio eleionomae TaxID=2653505 RepID=A0A7X4RX25_9VIBR|nr:OmpA family protein [Vibrio eleionomae]MZI96022.1 OmpA family protein [Vibrio eleionomae]